MLKYERMRYPLYYKRESPGFYMWSTSLQNQIFKNQIREPGTWSSLRINPANLATWKDRWKALYPEIWNDAA